MRTLSSSWNWSVFLSEALPRVYVAPTSPARLREPPNESGEIVAYSRDGVIVERWPWPFMEISGFARYMLRYGAPRIEGGWAIGRAPTGERHAVRLEPSAPEPLADEATQDDLQIGGAEVSREEHARAYREGWLILGARRGPVVDADIRARNPQVEEEAQAREARNAERLKRAKPWIGKRLEIRGLPFFDPHLEDRKTNEESIRPAIRSVMMPSPLRLNADGSLWCMLDAFNPWNYDMADLYHRAGASWSSQIWPVFALFGPTGRLRGYVLPSEQSFIAYPVDSAIYLREGDRLVRWAPVGR